MKTFNCKNVITTCVLGLGLISMSHASQTPLEVSTEQLINQQMQAVNIELANELQQSITANLNDYFVQLDSTIIAHQPRAVEQSAQTLIDQQMQVVAVELAAELQRSINDNINYSLSRVFLQDANTDVAANSQVDVSSLYVANAHE